jgi:hypothetical protein
MNIPFISNRMFFDGKYIETHPDKDEYIVIVSSKGTEEIA